jgi:DNA repair photolyase
LEVRETEAKSILRKHARIDSWFISSYGMNLYRGCAHNCAYCDGRAEGYYVEGDFGETVSVKTNAVDILRRELDPKRKRTPFRRGYVLLGGGVGDSYPPGEAKSRLAQQALDLLCERSFPVHALTKSTLVLRDMDLFKQINSATRAIVSFSFSSASDEISRVFEPRVPPPSQRLKAIESIKKEGLACGAFLMPVIPYVTDTEDVLEESVKRLKQAGVDFIIFGGMTLKEGRQKDYFMHVLNMHYPALAAGYGSIYNPGSRWGEQTAAYSQSVGSRFYRIAAKYGVPVRIPPSLYNDVIDTGDKVAVTLDNMDYLLRMRGEKSAYGYAAYLFSQLPPEAWQDNEKSPNLGKIAPAAQAVIREILATGRSPYYEKLLGV